LVIVPQVAPAHPAPERLHVTAVSELPFTVAENCCCAPVSSCMVVGETLTVTGVLIEIVAVPDLVPSASDVAVTFTMLGIGMMVGAV
jgi:hypothetical protein